MVISTSVQPLDGIPDNNELPAKLHESADQWRKLYELVDDLEVEMQRLEVVGIPEAKRLDEQAIATALDTNADTFPEGDEHERAARRDLLITERRYTVSEKALRDAGTELARKLLTHRKDLAAIHRPRIEAALTAYLNVVAQARNAVASAAAQLGEACAIAELLADLDLRSHRAAPAPLNVPISLDTTTTQQSVQGVLELLNKPLDDGLVDLIGSNGVRLTVSRDTAEQLIESEDKGIRYA